MALDKDKIAQGYDTIAESYTAWARGRFPQRLEYLDKVLPQLTADSHFLELGCGAGVPVSERLAQHVSRGSGRVTGNDISTRQLELARQCVPDADFIHGDMFALEFRAGSFDAVVSFFAIFHLPREEHEALFQRILSWLRPGGRFVGNLGREDVVDAKVDDFFGAEMHSSSFDAETTQSMLRRVGFELLEADVHAEGDVRDHDNADAKVRILWIVARKPVK